MLVGTHLLIGENVYNYVKGNMNIELDKKRFLYGNVKPDLIFRLSSKSHRIKDSLEFVLQEIDHLMKLKDISVSQFSVNLGVISHFMSDFFCSPHYYENQNFNGIAKHLHYELNLHYEFKKIFKSISDSFIEEEISTFHNITILEIISILQTSYTQSILSIKNDIHHALKASTLITKNIIENSSSYSSIKIAA